MLACALEWGDGMWGHSTEFLVSARTPINKLEDIEGHTVKITTLNANSDCKAPLALLRERYSSLPDRGYGTGLWQGHEDSIKRVAAKGLEAVPVASEVLARMVEKKEVDPAAVASIYKSERFPPASIGYVYHLAPELRDGIRETLLKFDWKGSGLEKEFGPAATKFVAVNYKDDWANTRRINQVIAEARKANAPKPNGN